MGWIGVQRHRVVLASLLALAAWSSAPTPARADGDALTLRVFTAAWCDSCHRQMTMLRGQPGFPKLSVKLSDGRIYTLNIQETNIESEEGSELFERIGKSSIPTTQLIRGGEVLATRTGAIDAAERLRGLVARAPNLPPPSGQGEAGEKKAPRRRPEPCPTEPGSRTIAELEERGCFQDDSLPLQPGTAPEYPTTPSACSSHSEEFRRGFRESASGQRFNTFINGLMVRYRQRALGPNSEARRACQNIADEQARTCCATGFRLGMKPLAEHILNGPSAEADRGRPCKTETCRRHTECYNNFLMGNDVGQQTCDLDANRPAGGGCEVLLLSPAPVARYLGCFHVGVLMRQAQCRNGEAARAFLEEAGVRIHTGELPRPGDAPREGPSSKPASSSAAGEGPGI